MNFLHFLVQRKSCVNTQRGMFTMGAMGSVALIVLALAATYGIYRYITNSYSVMIESTNLMSIVSGAKSLKTNGSYASVDNAALQRIRAFGNMTGGQTGGTVRNRWSGTVVVSGTASQLEIQYNDVPASACDRFLARATDSGEFATPLPTCAESGNSDLTFIAY